ncbi:MAG TPA: N-methyl-L-tryptophan oxidase [Acidimicrobiales bacterium]|nr:N-methyl-L-tryptophan oxidase [Acidimicrobiales bacterium]
MKDCDVVVVGAGVMGSATAWWLAGSGVETVLLEQFEQGHNRGSSHGSTRIFRLAYPDPAYMGMARQALPMWRELEDSSGSQLLLTTGGIDYGDSSSVSDIVDALVRTGVTHEIVDASEAARRWPGFSFDGTVVYQPDAGRISADAAVRALQHHAHVRGSDVRFGEPVRALTPHGDDSVVVSTDVGQYRARTVVVTAGAWASGLVAGLMDLPPLTVTREQVFHFQPRAAGTPWPAFIHHGDSFIYGLETPGGEGVKVAEHHTGTVTTADGRSFDVDEAGRDRVIEHVKTAMPGLDPTPTSATTCLYTNTPDESFVIERRGRVVVGSACSGHGFKFAPLIGRRLAQLATQPG